MSTWEVIKNQFMGNKNFNIGGNQSQFKENKNVKMGGNQTLV